MSLIKKLLGKKEILAVNDISTEDVDVPEWGGAVRVQTMNGEMRERYEEMAFGAQGKKGYDTRASLVAFCAVNEDGDLLFTVDEVGALGRKSYKALSRVFDAAVRLNSIGQAGVEEAVKN